MADQLHEPGGDGHRGRPAGARRPRGRHLRLAVRAVPARRRGARARRRASCGSTTSASTTSAGCSGVRDAGGARAARRPARRTTRGSTRFEEGRLFGGEWLRSLGMIPNEYLYYFYYAADTVNAIRGSAASRGRVPARAAARVLRAERRSAARTRWPPGAPPATTASARTWPRRAAPPATTSEHDHDANAGYESEAMAVLEAIALNSRAGADPQHREPLARCRSWTSARSSRCRASSAAPGPVPMAMGEVPAHARALVETMKDVERTTIDAALLGSRELAVQGARAAPARAVGDDRARDLRRLPRAAARAAGGVPGMSVDLACAEPAFLDLTMAGLDAIPRPGEERLATGLPALAGRRRDHRGRRRAARAVERARLAARRRRGRRSCCARCSPTTACAGTGGSWRARR